jgi:DNA repair protein RadC
MDQTDLHKQLFKKPRRSRPRGWKVVAVRETPPPETLMHVSAPPEAMEYWQQHVATAAHYNPDCECLVVLLINTKQRVRSHQVVSIGSLNETTAHPREIFRLAVAAAACSILLMHNHPSGEPEPSSNDMKLTKRIKDAGEILQITVYDHIIVGHQRYFSFRESGLM